MSPRVIQILCVWGLVCGLWQSGVGSLFTKVIGWWSNFDTAAGFLLFDVPAQKLFTLYTLIGEWAILFPVALGMVAFLLGRRRSSDHTPGSLAM